MQRSPHVMISSTFYDLRQIRTNIVQFLETELCYRAIASELPSFPIDPALDTIANCRKVVLHSVDILILIIGGRYGYIDQERGLSVTNIEYLTAKQKGIPVYCFVEEAILNVLPLWKANPAGDFSSVVDNTQVFHFVDEIRTKERFWTFPFRGAQNIIDIFRTQASYLFLESLQLRSLLGGGGIPSHLVDASPAVTRIALEKSENWEHRLFLQSFSDEVDLRSGKIRSHKAGLMLGQSENFAPMEMGEWSILRINELGMLAKSANTLMNVSTNEAFGPPGQSGSVEKILWVSRTLGTVLDKILDWSARVRCVTAQDPFTNMPYLLARLVDKIILEFEQFPVVSLVMFEKALSGSSASTEQSELKLTMTLRVDENIVSELMKMINEFSDELRAVAHRLKYFKKQPA